MEEQGILLNLKSTEQCIGEGMGKNIHVFFAVTFHDVTVWFNHDSFVYQILWSSGCELAPSYLRGPGCKFQYGAWLSSLMVFMVFFIHSGQTAEYVSNFVIIIIFTLFPFCYLLILSLSAMQSGILKASLNEQGINTALWY